MKYDSEIIEAFAQDLYSRANWVVFTHSILGTVFGGAIGTFGVAAMGGGPGLGGLIGAVIGFVIGNSLGRTRAFQYRLQAQTALCQVQIERNTNRGGQAISEGVAATEAAEAHLPTKTADGKDIMGTCPNCDAVLPLSAKQCKKCSAEFGGRNVWAIKPLRAEAWGQK